MFDEYNYTFLKKGENVGLSLHLFFFFLKIPLNSTDHAAADKLFLLAV